MIKDRLKEYFSFTKKERIGVLTLLTLIIIVFLLPNFYTTPGNKNNKAEFEKFKNEIAALKTKKTDSGRAAKNETASNNAEISYKPLSKKNNTVKVALFLFDPNTASVADFRRLAIREKTIQTIQSYLSKGGKFHKPEDMKKIYGLHENEYARLLPYIKIENTFPPIKGEKMVFGSKKNFSVSKAPGAIDINDADTSTFMLIPGIGSKLANRIVSFREKLGGFYSIDQIAETYYLPDSIFQKIKLYLKIENSNVKKININQADVATLKVHPYIKWNLANAIVQYRMQHGNYKSPEDLKQINVITPEIFSKISHYITN